MDKKVKKKSRVANRYFESSSEDVVKEKQKKKSKEGKAETVRHDEASVINVLDDDANIKRTKIADRRRKSKTKTKNLRQADPFPGEAPLPSDKFQKYSRGDQMDKSARTRYHKAKFSLEEDRIQNSLKAAVQSEVFLSEEAGFLAADREPTTNISQHDIQNSVDINSAQKFFDLKLPQFGPYRLNYTRNGRYLLIGGNKGHVAAIDWLTKKLMCEINVMETVNDVKWLHQETLFAAAQRQWTYVYDNQGIELHCLKALDSVLRLEFLPYHFLLVSSNMKGYLSYLDVSVGQKVTGFQTGMGRLDVMCQNPSNAIICLGHSRGTVTMWSPNIKEPLVTMLCHPGGVRSIDVDRKGNYLATSGTDRTIKIWDLRTFKMLQSYKVGAGASHLSFSQREILAAGIGNVVEVYEDCCRNQVSSPYLTHRLHAGIRGMQFCPFEDVLGVGHGQGFTSLLIPGAGEANFDAMETNPYQTKSQRRQAEVKMLLEKISPDMIHLDTTKIGKVDGKTLQETIQEKNKLIFLKPQKVDFVPKYKKKGRSKTGRVEKRKKGFQEFSKRAIVKELIVEKEKQIKERQLSKDNKGSGNVLDRFKKKPS
ncbi:WD repeat-containing protein 46-like [Liolophura sinensis]|uniref:WD repeat-containing protein 46-like n=1 Tax=Liolophura sinensis TaxID=3198878 RepID=UPI0031597875